MINFSSFGGVSGYSLHAAQNRVANFLRSSDEQLQFFSACPLGPIKNDEICMMLRTDPQPLLLFCFGRGGSNMVFSTLGSVPGTVIMEHEWHQSVFEKSDWLKKVLRRLARKEIGLDWGQGTGPLSQWAQNVVRQRMLAGLRTDAPWADDSPRYLVAKVMDYNIHRRALIGAAFGQSIRSVVLTRAPLPQIEGLTRSGQSLEAACRWYNDIATPMAAVLDQPGTHHIRFEDLIADPVQILEGMLSAFDLEPASRYYLKNKTFGAARDVNTDVKSAPYTFVERDELPQFVSAEVNQKAVARLSEAQKAEIIARTETAARALGYAPDAY